MTQREAIVALLRSRFDWIPGPATATGKIVARSAKPGAQKLNEFACPRCQGRGELGRGAGAKPCGRCEGAGSVLDNAYLVDREPSPQALLRLRVTGEDESRLLRRQREDRELRRLQLAALHREGKIDPAEAESWERAKEALYRQGDYALLERALRKLERRSAYDRSALELVYGYDSPLREIGPALKARAERALELLGRLLPAELRVPAYLDPAQQTAAQRELLWRGHGPAAERGRLLRAAEIVRLRDEAQLAWPQICQRVGLADRQVRRLYEQAKEEVAA